MSARRPSDAAVRRARAFADGMTLHEIGKSEGRGRSAVHGSIVRVLRWATEVCTSNIDPNTSLPAGFYWDGSRVRYQSSPRRGTCYILPEPVRSAVAVVDALEGVEA